MRIQSKLMLSIFPILLLGFVSLGLLSYFSTRDLMHSNAFRYIDTVLDSRLDHTFQRRENLLRATKMDKVRSFVTLYQQEAMAELAVGSDSRYGCFLIFDRKGNKIFNSGNCAVEEQLPLFRISALKALANPVHIDRGQTDGGTPRHFGTRYFEPWNWVIVYSVDTSGFEKSINRNLLAAFLLASLCVAASALLVGIVFRMVFSRPVERLKIAAARIANREPNVEIQVTSRDELGDLAASINALSKAIFDYIHNLERLKADLERTNKSMQLEINERWKAQTDLNDANNKLAATLNAIPDLLFELDGEGRIHDYHAPEHQELFVPPEQFLGKRFCEVLPPGPAKAIMEAIAIAATKGRYRGTVYSLDLPTGKNWFEFSIAAKGELVGPETRFVALVHNITERIQQEEKAHQLRMEVETILRHAPVGIAHFKNGQVISWNRRLEELFGDVPGKLSEQVTKTLLENNERFNHLEEYTCADLGEYHRFNEEFRFKKENGNHFWCALTGCAIDPKHPHEGSIWIFADITGRKKAEEEINNLAFYDSLTQLPNRRLLLDRLEQALAVSARSGRYGALLFIDLDNFKALNDTFGHDVGDLLLQQVAVRLLECVREVDTVARLGGDEFVIMLEDIGETTAHAVTHVETVGDKILSALNQPYQLSSHTHHSTPSIGVTLFTGQQQSTDELLKYADLAMYQAKSAGRNTLRFFDQEMQTIVTERMNLEADLREAVKRGQFVLHYQVQVVGEGRPTGAEVLLRWHHPLRGVVSPAEFIPLAEDTKLILQIGDWVLVTACNQLAAWESQQTMANLTLAVNVSAKQLRQKDFVNHVLAALEHSGANPRRLKLELTESLLVDDVEDIIAKMAMLKAKGVGFSLDDFGTGYSSLYYLKRLPLDQLKIDQGFVRDILTDPNDTAIAKMIVALARSMGLAVIAEGVELEAQRDFLARHGCHAYQGYLFGRPLPVEEFEEFLTSSPTAPARLPHTAT